MRLFSRHVSRQLAANMDGELVTQEAQRVELHLARCKRCRGEREQIQFGMVMLDHLPAAQAPDAIWRAIETELPEYLRSRSRSAQPWRLALAALALIAVAGTAYWSIHRHSRTGWELVQISGTPDIDAKPTHGVARIRAGEWIETNSSSSATVKVGDIGSVEVTPGTRLLVVRTRPDEHRLALARGEIHAKISAPPRLFFVDTASGTAVDLGCEYSLRADERGAGRLDVTKGWVSFKWKGFESLVPAGASCRTEPLTGPGVPYFDDAPAKFKHAVETFATDKFGSGLGTILSEARVRDTLTLWHLLFRVGIGDRERIYDRIAALTPVPAGVSREKVMKLDADTLARWKDELAWTW